MVGEKAAAATDRRHSRWQRPVLPSLLSSRASTINRRRKARQGYHSYLLFSHQVTDSDVRSMSGTNTAARDRDKWSLVLVSSGASAKVVTMEKE